MDNAHADNLLTAMIKLTEAIERLNQRLQRPTGAWECLSDGSVRPIPYRPPVDGAIGAEYGESMIIPD